MQSFNDKVLKELLMRVMAASGSCGPHDHIHLLILILILVGFVIRDPGHLESELPIGIHNRRGPLLVPIVYPDEDIVRSKSKRCDSGARSMPSLSSSTTFPQPPAVVTMMRNSRNNQLASKKMKIKASREHSGLPLPGHSRNA